MKTLEEAFVLPNTPIRKVIEVLDASAKQIILVVDARKRLVGTVTDGDVRRGILKGIQLDQSSEQIMNTSPTVMNIDEDREAILAMMQRKGLRHIPLVDKHQSVVGIETLENLSQSTQTATRDNWVVLMAGGLGSRLRPMTEECPKSMLTIGSKPLLETILENFIGYGLRKFYISVNHMADVLISHFGDGSKWGVEIRYLHEDHRLGTAGPLGLFPEKPSEAILVMNGDVLTKVNFKQMLDFHSDHSAQATMCVREYDFQVPYGVVKIDSHQITGIDEKPIQRFFVNAGIYILEPDVLDLISENVYLDMPTLFETLIEGNLETAAFPIREYWLDIGHPADFDRANGEFTQEFT